VNFTREETLYNTIISYTSEFYSELGMDDIKALISSSLGRKVYPKDSFQLTETLMHDYLRISKNSAGKYSMTTGYLRYSEGRLYLTKMLNMIDENFSTEKDCSLNFSVMYSAYDQPGTPDISRLDSLKFILEYDENIPYTYFPERKNVLYSKSIKNILPGSKFFTESSANISSRNYSYPFQPYFAVDFSSLKRGNLTFRYIGGEDYQKKEGIREIIEYSSLTLYSCIRNPYINEKNKAELDKILSKHQAISDSYSSATDFKRSFPDITLMVNLQSDKRVIDTMYPYIRDKIYNLLIECNFQRGYLNYDSNNGKLQIKDAEINNAYLIENIDIFDSKIEGTVSNCDIFQSEIKESEIFRCNLFDRSKAINCYLYNSYVNGNSILNESTVEGDLGIFSGKMKDGVFVSGKITQSANLSDTTKVISYQKIS
jgi:hypothetical protein